MKRSLWNSNLAYIILILPSLSLVLWGLGFNTLDAMMAHYFYTNDPAILWSMNTYIKVERWNAYFYFGILPITIGAFLTGVETILIYRLLACAREEKEMR